MTNTTSYQQTAGSNNCYLFGCRYDVIVDIAGGNGQLLAELLSKHGSLQGLLVDQQEQVERGNKVNFMVTCSASGSDCCTSLRC
jgi:hypothetical protein